ncbi:hypothetical protein [Piscinibacter sp. XHJ-5]|uniref:hypothetical protein n=1 Tax=Piscinibacter sp. XHJ-5 TaxID=3037797 RepID=UPI0024531179|nr:hypothetical protein [Piscinibacter sp. XHJ-5]
MSQQIESDVLSQERWESACFAAMLSSRDVDREEAKLLIRAAWSIERYRTLAPVLAAKELLQNPAIQPSRRMRRNSTG